MELYYADGTPKKWWSGVLEPAFPGLHGGDDFSDLIPMLNERGMVSLDSYEIDIDVTRQIKNKGKKRVYVKRKPVQPKPKPKPKQTSNKKFPHMYTIDEDVAYIWTIVDGLIKLGRNDVYWLSEPELTKIATRLRQQAGYNIEYPLDYRKVVRMINRFVKDDV